MTSCRFVSTTSPRVLTDRHSGDCADDECRGCLPCPEMHCVVCSKAHAKAACVECLEAARSDLKAIWSLCDSLPLEAAEKGVQSEAAMLWGPSADPEAWRNRATSAMVGRIDASYLEDCRDEMHPLWVLGTWEQIWRDHLDHFTEQPLTVLGAAAYLDLQIGYMSEQAEPPFDEFARELRQCRGHLEDVLRDGIREERTQVPCIDCTTRLIKTYAQNASDDHWRCATCRRTYNAEEFARARHFHLDENQPEKFVKVSVALGMIDRPEQSLRTWMANEKVKTERDESGVILVWWPDVWVMHRDTPVRRRRSA